MFAFAAYFAVVDAVLVKGINGSSGLLHEVGAIWKPKRTFTSTNSRSRGAPASERRGTEEVAEPPCRKPAAEAADGGSSRRATTNRLPRSGSSSTPIRASRTRWRNRCARRAEAFGFADKIGQILIPTEEVVELRNGKKVTSKRLVYPGYVLVEMEMNDALWHEVKNTPRVTGFVGGGNSPVPLSADEVNSILYRQASSAERPRPKMTFEKNDSVRIVDGPFANFSGKVDEVNTERGTLRVMVTIFGRATPVELEFLQVEKGLRIRMAKKVTAQVKLQIPAGKATPAPPVGTALGPQGVNIMDFCKAFNAKTSGKDQEGLIIPVVITIFSDRSFTFITKTPPVPVLIKRAVNLAKGSAEPHKNKVGKITQAADRRDRQDQDARPELLRRWKRRCARCAALPAAWASTSFSSELAKVDSCSRFEKIEFCCTMCGCGGIGRRARFRF